MQVSATYFDLAKLELTWAVRLAIEIGLNTPGFSFLVPDLEPALSRRNDERTWLSCIMSDRSWAVQTGRQTILEDDPRFLRLDEWLIVEGANFEDATIVAMMKLRRIMVSVL